MKKIISRNKSIGLLLFLFGYGNLFASDGGACRAYLRTIEKVDNLSNLDSCYLKNSYVYRLPDYPHAIFVISVSSMKILSFNQIVPGGEGVLFASRRTTSYFGEQENRVIIKLNAQNNLFIVWSIEVNWI